LDYSLSEYASAARTIQNEPPQTGNSLAQAFLKRKLAAADIRTSPQEASTSHRESVESKVEPKKGGKTKEELAEIRKQMMKRRPTTSSNNTINTVSDQKSVESSDPRDELLSRLAKGEKT
jgi:hypothetical protein